MFFYYMTGRCEWGSASESTSESTVDSTTDSTAETTWLGKRVFSTETRPLIAFPPPHSFAIVIIMEIIYSTEKAPKKLSRSIFLAGPSPRKEGDMNWRPEALRLLEEVGFDGVVFVPLPRDGVWPANYDDQAAWETEHLNMADVILFWVPRDLEKLPAFTTNVEFGLWLGSGKVVLGYPPGTAKMKYLDWHARRVFAPVHDTLEATVKEAVAMTAAGAERSGGERSVPLLVWNTPQFQAWIAAQRGAGNRLDGARVLWSYRVGPGRGFTYAFAVRVDVWVAAEDRHKSNEFIVARPDIAAVIAYRRAPVFEDSTVVLAREFRSPARTEDAFIRELPGGSVGANDGGPAGAAAKELLEETGLAIGLERLRPVGIRQLAGTFSLHAANVFAVELTEAEMAAMRETAAKKERHGTAGSSEQVYVEVHRLGDIFDGRSGAVDWSNLGMIAAALVGGGSE